VFTNEVGRPIDASNLVKCQFYPLLRCAGLPVIRFHDLRHTCATLPLLQGVNPKIVSELLGHSSVGFTLDRYSHVLPSMQRAAADAMARALFGE
jgi:integrase